MGRWRFVIGVFSLLIAAAAAVVGNVYYEQLVATIEVPVAAVPIEPYTVISPAMLTTREVPRSLVTEPIYQTASGLVGRIATVPIMPATMIYIPFAADPKTFRLVPDPALEVVSFPVSPASAVGGQVRPGLRINIYRTVVVAAQLQGFRDLPIEDLLETRAAASAILAANVPVVDVRSQQGESAQPVTAPAGNPANARTMPLQIITVAVPPETARDIVTLVGETSAAVQLWVSLAPLSAVSVAESVPSAAP